MLPGFFAANVADGTATVNTRLRDVPDHEDQDDEDEEEPDEEEEEDDGNSDGYSE